MGLADFIEQSWLPRFTAIALLSVVGAQLAASAAGEGAAHITRKEGALEFTATGGLAGFLIVFFFALRGVPDDKGLDGYVLARLSRLGSS